MPRVAIDINNREKEKLLEILDDYQMFKQMDLEQHKAILDGMTGDVMGKGGAISRVRGIERRIKDIELIRRRIKESK